MCIVSANNLVFMLSLRGTMTDCHCCITALYMHLSHHCLVNGLMDISGVWFQY